MCQFYRVALIYIRIFFFFYSNVIYYQFSIAAIENSKVFLWLILCLRYGSCCLHARLLQVNSWQDFSANFKRLAKLSLVFCVLCHIFHFNGQQKSKFEITRENQCLFFSCSYWMSLTPESWLLFAMHVAQLCSHLSISITRECVNLAWETPVMFVCVSLHHYREERVRDG